MTHLLSLWPAADLQTLGLTDGHLQAQRDPHMLQVLCLGVKGQTLHIGQVIPTETRPLDKHPTHDFTWPLMITAMVKSILLNASGPSQ